MEPDETIAEGFNPAEYKKGFNDAYMLAEYAPEILADITPDINPSNNFFDGFFAGKIQWEQDRLQSQVNELTELRSKSDDRSLEMEH